MERSAVLGGTNWKVEKALVFARLRCLAVAAIAQARRDFYPSDMTLLSALGQAASKPRGTLRESLASVQKYDVPIEQVTTTSLDALKAFAQGDAEFDRGKELEPLAYYRQAIELDPNFAWVYARMSSVYINAGEIELAREYTRKAYELKDRVSEREKLYITKNYLAQGSQPRQ